MKYRIWTGRALLVWTPVVSALLAGGAAGMAHPAAEWHQRLVGLLIVVGTAVVVGRRHQMHRRIRDSISFYLPFGTRVINDVAPASDDTKIMGALERGFREAQRRAAHSPLISARDWGRVHHAFDEAFVILQMGVIDHWTGKARRVEALTFPSGTMVMSYVGDLARLEALAVHEGAHLILLSLGIQDIGGSHHRDYAELFA